VRVCVGRRFAMDGGDSNDERAGEEFIDAPRIKCVLVGDGIVGKIDFLLSFLCPHKVRPVLLIEQHDQPVLLLLTPALSQDLQDLEYKPTVFENHETYMTVDDMPVILHLW
jgi:hypothetical protein